MRHSKYVRVLALCALAVMAAACSAASPPATGDLPATLTTAGISRIDRASDGSDLLLDARGVRLGQAREASSNGEYSITLDWQGRASTLKWSATKFSYDCDGANVTYDVATGATSGALTDECRSLSDISYGIAAHHEMPSPLATVVGKSQAHTQDEAMMIEGAYCIDYTNWGGTASTACNAALVDCGGNQYCHKTAQNCGVLYCTCTYQECYTSY